MAGSAVDRLHAVGVVAVAGHGAVLLQDLELCEVFYAALSQNTFANRIFWGPAGAWGFALGSVISFGNAWWTHRIAMSVGPGGEKPAGAALIAVFRYLLMLALLYVILSYSEISFLAALAGCFTHIIAVVLEVVYELTYGTS